jgi:hypothetical protein
MMRKKAAMASVCVLTQNWTFSYQKQGVDYAIFFTDHSCLSAY